MVSHWYAEYDASAPLPDLPPDNDGQDYVGCTARVIPGGRQGLPPAGTEGAVVESLTQCGELVHRVTWPDGGVLTTPLPVDGVELLTPAN